MYQIKIPNKQYQKGDEVKEFISLTISEEKVNKLEKFGAEPKTPNNTLTIAYMNRLLSAMLSNKFLYNFITAIKSGNKFIESTEEEREAMKPYIAELNKFRYLEIPTPNEKRYIALVNLGVVNDEIIHHQVSRMFNIAYEIMFWLKDTTKGIANIKKAINYAIAIQNEYVKSVGSKDLYSYMFREEKGCALQALTADLPNDEIYLPRNVINFLTGGKYDKLNNKQIVEKLKTEELNVENIRHPILNHICIQRVTGIAPYGCAYVTTGVLETLLQGDTDGDQIFVYLFDKGKTTSEEDIKQFRPSTFLNEEKQEGHTATLNLEELCEAYEGKENQYIKSAKKNKIYNNWEFTDESYKSMLETTLQNLISVKEGVALTGYYAKCLDLIVNHSTKELADNIGVSQKVLKEQAKTFIRKIKEAALDIKHDTKLMEEQPWYFLVQEMENNGDINNFIEGLLNAGIEIEEKSITTLSKKYQNNNKDNLNFDFSDIL